MREDADALRTGRPVAGEKGQLRYDESCLAIAWCRLHIAGLTAGQEFSLTVSGEIAATNFTHELGKQLGGKVGQRNHGACALRGGRGRIPSSLRSKVDRCDQIWRQVCSECSDIFQRLVD